MQLPQIQPRMLNERQTHANNVGYNYNCLQEVKNYLVDSCEKN